MNNNERITFQSATSTTNDYGEATNTWSNISTDPTMWAKAQPRTGREDWNAEQKQGFQRYMFTINYRSDITESMRISWNGKYWDIRSVTSNSDTPRHTKTEIIAEWRQGKYE